MMLQTIVEPVVLGFESARSQTTMRVEQNTITFDYKVTYAEYAVGEWLGVTVGYSATCPVVFKGLTLRQPTPSMPSGQVTGEIANVSGTPMAGQAARTGSATFNLHFTSLHTAATGAHSGTTRLNLVLGKVAPERRPPGSDRRSGPPSPGP